MEVKEFEQQEEMAEKGAGRIAELAARDIKKKGFFTMVLSGGNSPRLIYEKLAQPPLKDKIEWEKVFIFWGDERYIAKTANDSNYRMANDAFVSKINIPPENIFAIPVEVKPIEEAARKYEAAIRKFAQKKGMMSEDNKFPVFDLVILGVGVDGHTASLFPGHRAVNEATRWVDYVKAHARATLRERITITLPVINAGKEVMFVVSGYGKSAIVRDIFSAADSVKNLYPAALVKPDGRSVWYIDKKIYGS